MHKALMGLILAATAMTPVAAQAQQTNDRSEHYQRLERRNQQRHEQRQQRQEAREQRQEARQQAQQDQPAPVVRRQRAERVDGGERTVRRDGDFRRNRSIGGVQVDPQVVQQAQQERVIRRQRFDNQTTGSASQAWQGDPNDPRRQRYEKLERRNQWRYGTSEQRDAIRDQWRDRDGRDWRRGDRDWRRGDRDWRRNWDRDWRRDRRYDWSSWRWRNRSLFRLSPYYSPYNNWNYSRFSIGLFMPSLFYGQRYWLTDPGYYRLPPAPPGTQWIRYYNDVLLVDTWSGEVVDVIYNFFW